MSPGIPTRLLATQSDERLLALVRDGHERAFEALVNRYRRPLLSYCRRLSLSEARAEDVVQQALLKTWVALRAGAEVRDIKAWLYRVVHNTAVNAVRDAANDRERLADPTLRCGAGQADLERGLAVREALAEVAALPALQREVIVRTAVGGHSHEQVASDLGITDGAVRGLLYRARVALRTAVTALTPPSLLNWVAGRAEQGAPVSERIGELAAGGGAAGFGGLLLKGGALLSAATLLTGAAVVRLQGSNHPHSRPARGTAREARLAAAGTIGRPVVLAPAATGSVREHARPPRAVDVRSGAGPHADVGKLVSSVGAAPRALHLAHVAPTRPTGASVVRPAPPRVSAPAGSTEDAASPQGTGSTPSSGQAEVGAGSGSGAGASSGGPVGTAAGTGSGSNSSSGSGSNSGAGAGSETAPSGGSTQTPSGSESSGASNPSASGESSGAQSGAGATEPAGGGQSGGVIGTVVHGVGSLVEHLLH